MFLRSSTATSDAISAVYTWPPEGGGVAVTMTKTNIGTRDGRPLYHYAADPTDHVVVTGPVTGVVTTTDGRVYDVTENVIRVDSAAHAGEVSHLIGAMHEDVGHPDHQDGEPYFHLCTSECGVLRRDLTDPMQAAATVAAQIRTDAIPDGATRAHYAAALGTSGGGPSAARASAAAENAALNGLDGTGSTNVIPDVSLHTADPGTTGASENANSGSYARLACSWNAASSGTKTNSTALTFTTGGSVAVTYLGTWSSATYAAGNYAIGGALTSSVTAVTITVASGAISLSAS